MATPATEASHMTTLENNADHHVRGRGQPHLATQRYANVQLEANREEQQCDAQIRHRFQLGHLPIESVDDESRRQKPDQWGSRTAIARPPRPKVMTR